MPAHPNIAQVMAMDDQSHDALAVMFELAPGGDFSRLAWGKESATMATLMR